NAGRKALEVAEYFSARCESESIRQLVPARNSDARPLRTRQRLNFVRSVVEIEIHTRFSTRIQDKIRIIELTVRVNQAFLLRSSVVDVGPSALLKCEVSNEAYSLESIVGSETIPSINDL